MKLQLITLIYPQIDITNSVDLRVASAAAPVPEPATMLLFGTGLVGFAKFWKNFRRIKEKSVSIPSPN